jgi:hypothetical protein
LQETTTIAKKRTPPNGRATYSGKNEAVVEVKECHIRISRH